MLHATRNAATKRRFCRLYCLRIQEALLLQLMSAAKAAAFLAPQ
jgi:hypothetical protein